MGKDSLGDLLSQLSKELKLSKRYTNHCVRVTGINIMHEKGMSNSEIATVTGQKSTASVQRYIRTSDRQLKRASDCLAYAGVDPDEEEIKEENKTIIVKNPDERSSDNGQSSKEMKQICINGPFYNCSFNF